jgi:glutamate/tyrosine decarboxylase-like PLP-dependent enzyme
MLKLSREEMRSFGYRVIDLLVDHFETIGNQRVTNHKSRPELESRLREPIPKSGMSPEAVLQEFQQKIQDAMMHPDHPRFFAFIPSPSNFVGTIADALASGLNVFAGTWIEASGPAEVELLTIDWLRAACDLPEQAGGLFVSGGSVANITAIATARNIHLAGKTDGAIVYCSDQTHSSIERGVRVLGFQPDQFRKLPSDDHFRIDLSSLASAVESDRRAGKRPFCVVANAGTTNTGAIDPIPQLAEFCEEQNLWLHIDGAFGAAAALCERGKELLKGIGKVHSLSMDPHKWLFQPFEIGCVLVRDRSWLKQTFQILPEYMKDVESGAEEVNFCDYGIQLTRSFRALKLWMSLKLFGSEAFAAAIEHGFRSAEFAESVISGMKDWEIVTPAQMAIVTFRYAPKGISIEETNKLNQEIAKGMTDDGFALVLTTQIRGKIVLRLCPINPRTTEDDVGTTLVKLDEIARDLNSLR